jgi:adenosine deaminase
VDGLECESLEEYLQGFEITNRVLQKTYALTRVMYELAEDCYSDGVRYVEVRFSPILHTRDGMELSQAMSAVCDGLAMAQHRFSMTVRIIVCGMRHMDPSVSCKLAEIAWRYKHKGVVAFDLAGPESGFTSVRHAAAFKLVRAQCLNCTLHAGEGDDWTSVQDALRECGAHRIGHGVRMWENKRLAEFIIDRRVPLEVCITSNVQTKAVASLKDHPIRRFFYAGVIVVPCTDNRTVSSVTLTSEYDLLQRTFGFNLTEIVKMIDYGFRAAFLEVTRQRRLRAEALHTIAQLVVGAGLEMDPVTHAFPFHRFGGVYFDEIGQPYWGKHKNPPLTAEIIQLLPKGDLHCRLNGSVSVATVWDEVQYRVTLRAGLASVGLFLLCAFFTKCCQELFVFHRAG